MMDLDMDFEEIESEDEGPFSVVKKPKVDLAETTDKADNVVLSFAAARTKDHGPEATTIAAEAPATATVSNTSAWSRFQFQFRPRSQSCPTITEVHDQSSRTGTTHFRGHRLGAHVFCRRCKVRDDDSDSSGSLQDEAGDVQPAKPIKALEKKEPKLDLIPEPEIKSDADSLGLEVSQEIVDTMSRDDLERLLWKKVAEAKQVRAQLAKSEETVALSREKLAQVCKKLIDVKRAQVEMPEKFRNEWKDVRNKGDIPSSTTFALRRQEPNLAHIIDLTDDVSEEDEEDKAAAAAAAARSAIVAQVANAVKKANAFLRESAIEAAKENVQPAAATSSSGGREGVILKRASRLPLAPLRRRP